MLTVAIKPLLDRYTYDQDSIASCCHHTTDTSGRLLWFCGHSAIWRGRDSLERFPRPKEIF
jgi:uncharacterized radical SAM superfamily Fe-S cluster-containing enzyme